MNELQRRRTILGWHIGDAVQLKKRSLKRNDPLRGLTGILLVVRRTRASIDFGSLGRWNVPIESILLPGAVEPDPRQRPLFSNELFDC